MRTLNRLSLFSRCYPRLGEAQFVGHRQAHRLGFKDYATRAAVGEGQVKIATPDELDLELSYRVNNWFHQYASRERIFASAQPPPLEYRSQPGELPLAWLRIFPNVESVSAGTFCAALNLCRASDAPSFLKSHDVRVGGLRVHPSSVRVPLPPPPSSYDDVEAYGTLVTVDGAPRGYRLRPLHLLANTPAPAKDIVPSSGWFTSPTAGLAAAPHTPAHTHTASTPLVPPSASVAYSIAIDDFRTPSDAWNHESLAPLRAAATPGLVLPPVPAIATLDSRATLAASLRYSSRGVDLTLRGATPACGGVSVASCDPLLCHVGLYHPSVATVWDVAVSPSLTEDAWVTLRARILRFGGKLPYSELFGRRQPRRAVPGAAAAAALAGEEVADDLVGRRDLRHVTRRLEPHDPRRTPASDALSGIVEAATDYADRDGSDLEPQTSYHTHAEAVDSLVLLDACDVRRPDGAAPAVIRITLRGAPPAERLGALCRALGVRPVAVRRVGYLTPNVDPAADTLTVASLPPGGFRPLSDGELRGLWSAVAPTGLLPPPIAPSAAALVTSAETEDVSGDATAPPDAFADVLAPTRRWMRRRVNVRDVAMGAGGKRAPTNMGFFVRPT